MTLYFLSQFGATMELEFGKIIAMIKPQHLAIPLYFLAIAIELFVDWRRRTNEYEIKDTFTNLFVGTVSVLWGLLFVGVSLSIYQFCYELTPLKVPETAWWAWVLLFFLDDFAYYWFHRFSHESRFLWNFHVVHHSSEHYNLSVALRQSWFGHFVTWMFYFPIALLGFPPWMIVTMHGLNLVYQFWIHTRFIKDLGWFEFIFNTPAHHRVHHGVNNPYLDKNYAGALIIWDRMFGTFVPEAEEPRYGIIKQLNSFNPLWINTHGWVEMWQAMRERKNLSGKLRCVFGSPNMDFEEKLILSPNVKKQV